MVFLVFQVAERTFELNTPGLADLMTRWLNVLGVTIVQSINTEMDGDTLHVLVIFT